MIPVPLWAILAAVIAGMVALGGSWAAGDAHGHKAEHTAMQSVIDKTIISATKVADDTERNQRESNHATGNSFAASAVGIAAAVAAVDTGGLRFRTCPRSDLPEAAASRPALDGTGTAASAVTTGTVDFADVARQIAELDGERARLAAKVAGLQKTIRDEPGYTDGN